MYQHYMNCFCKDRYFDPLPGFIDVELLTCQGAHPDTGAPVLALLPSPGLPYAVPTCYIKPCTPEQRAVYDKLLKE